MEKLIREIRKIIKENRAQLEALPAKERAAWVMIWVLTSDVFMENRPESALTNKDAALGYIHTVSTLIKRILKEEGLWVKSFMRCFKKS